MGTFCGMTDWQKMYEDGVTPWDRGGPCPPLMEWLETGRLHGRVLVPGCGHGHDLVALAQSGAAHITGLDIAPGAIAAAQEKTAGLENVELITGDLFALGAGALRGQFDWVFEHTCFCAINPALRPDYVQAVASALKPGGHLLAVFYLEPWDEGEDPNQGPPFRSEVPALDAQFSGAFELVTSRVPTVAYPGREGKELLRLLRRRD